MKGFPKRVHDEGEGSEKSNEGQNACVEELLSREDIGQLQGSVQPQIMLCMQPVPITSSFTYLPEVPLWWNLAGGLSKAMTHQMATISMYLCVDHCESNGHGQVDPGLQEGNGLCSTPWCCHHKHILCMAVETY